MSGMAVFHEGEIAVQERAGERDVALANGRIVHPVIPEGARPFLARQRMLVIAHGAPWASVRFGAPGFVSSTDGEVIRLDHGLPPGAPVGLLAIDFMSRRRLRVNGIVSGPGLVRVTEAYPNCPKYIQRRTLDLAGDVSPVGVFAHGTGLDAIRRAAIERADTMFVATLHPKRGMDASHRGGEPGFARVSGDRVILPDYPGNGMFNTLGNLEVEPRAGLTVLDFERSAVIEMTGYGRLDFDAAREEDHTAGGTGRFWTFDVASFRELPMPKAVRFGPLLEPSPYNP